MHYENPLLFSIFINEMSINIRGRIYISRLINIYREFHVTASSKQYTHEMSKEMATVEQIKSGLIDKIHSIKNREVLEALENFINVNDSEIEALTDEQKAMLEMSEQDVKDGNLISQEEMMKKNLEWLNAK